MRRGGQRIKGRAFEQKLCRILRAKFPGVEVRRSSQAERAYEADVFSRGHAVLDRCWFECTDGRAPNVRKKLEQAERDVARGIPHHGDHDRLPVVVWHRLNAKEINVTMRLGTLKSLAFSEYSECRGNPLVTLDLYDFLDLVVS